jgi:3-methyladenine DNA glycosylase AlkD
VTTAATARNPGATTAAATAFVATHMSSARELGRRLADAVDEPDRCVEAARDGLAAIADPAYLAGQRMVAPGIGPLLGVRLPLLEGVDRALRHELRDVREARLVPLAEALARDPIRELRWLACWLLGRLLPGEPERAWQVLRRMAAESDDWITVDTLASTMAAGILQEPYRWAELEQLVYSSNRWERRLVGSTVATMPFADRAAGRTPEVVAHGLALVGLLIGDPEPDVQKALSWALRSLARVDPVGVTRFCRDEARRAAATGDGARAWVVRGALARLDSAAALELRAVLAGVRRSPRAANTSTASATAAAFREAGRGATPFTPPLT